MAASLYPQVSLDSRDLTIEVADLAKHPSFVQIIVRLELPERGAEFDNAVSNLVPVLFADYEHWCSRSNGDGSRSCPRRIFLASLDKCNDDTCDARNEGYKDKPDSFVRDCRWWCRYFLSRRYKVC